MKNKAKRKYYIYKFIFTILIAVIVVIMAFPRIIWELKDVTELNGIIFDKTVSLESDYQEHKGFSWILNYKKIALNGKLGVDYSKDYYGYDPVEKKERFFKGSKENYDFIYITDTYGVYKNEYEGISESKEKIVGGFEKEEILEIKSVLKNGVTLIGEFNTLASPTKYENRVQLEDIFGIKWSGWIGRYYEDLSYGMEIGDWTVKRYEEINNKQWRFSGPGIILISENDEVVVLEEKKEFYDGGMKFKFTDSNEVHPYYYWFEILDETEDSEVRAEYSIELTESGKKILSNLGLKSKFPAIVFKDNLSYKSYYFAGDYSDSQSAGGIYKYQGITKFKTLFSLESKGDRESFFWKMYYPYISQILDNSKTNPIIEERARWEFRTSENLFQKKSFDGLWENFIVKGVNMGFALPGKWFREFPDRERLYYEWFKDISDMNANTIRVYTLMDPSFYSALSSFNMKNKEEPLYLMQEVWPDEEVPNGNFFDIEYQNEYEKEIRYVIDAVHGNIEIPERFGRAYGKYHEDISEYIIAYMIGRELEPEQVLETDRINRNYKFDGNYFYTSEKARPTEGWLAMNLDYAVTYEKEKYGNSHMVSIVSWPTLDIKEHDSEWNEEGNKSLRFNDKAVVDINNIEVKDNFKNNFFGSYHIYPNYPDFMNNETYYNNFSDGKGRFRYKGYLNEFMENHKKYPALVAEFGIANGMKTAHISPDGLNHGGISEINQGLGIVRMMNSILDEGYAGGIIFEWLDEWAKKTWTTEPFMIPYEEHIYWHNEIDPEQNYGLVSFDVFPDSEKEKIFISDDKSRNGIYGFSVNIDAGFLYISTKINEEFDILKDKILIGIDILDENRGEFFFGEDVQNQSASGNEFLLEIAPSGCIIKSIPSYNIGNRKYTTEISKVGKYQEIMFLVNGEAITKDGKFIKAKYENYSKMKYGNFDKRQSNWYVEDNNIYVRIPWGILNFTDPRNMIVLDEKNSSKKLIRDNLDTVKSDGIAFNILYKKNDGYIFNYTTKNKRYMWEPWKTIEYQQRLKDSYYIIKDYFKTIE